MCGVRLNMAAPLLQNHPPTHTHTHTHSTGCLCKCLARTYTVYSKTSPTDHLHKSTTPLYRSLYLGPKQSPIQYQYNAILTVQLPKPTTSRNGPLKVGPMVGRFREVSLYLNPRRRSVRLRAVGRRSRPRPPEGGPRDLE